jgi:hypothetical protein
MTPKKDPLTRLQNILQAQNDLLDDLRNALQEYVLVQDNIIKELEEQLK